MFVWVAKANAEGVIRRIGFGYLLNILNRKMTIVIINVVKFGC